MSMTAEHQPTYADLPNLDEQWWNENWLRIMQRAIDEGAIAPHELKPALEDAKAHMAELAAAPRPIAPLEMYRGVVYPVRGPIPASFASLKIQSAPTAPVLDVTGDPMSAWTLSPLVAQLFAGAFAVPDAGPCRGFILMAEVPAERILSNGLTGLGNLQIAEHVIIGSKLAAAVREIPHTEPGDGGS